MKFTTTKIITTLLFTIQIINLIYGYIPVYVMMPLNTITNDGKFNQNTILPLLQKLQSTGADGIMVDVWWGIVERNGPKNYDFSAYRQLFNICKNLNFKIQVVLSFHQCGTNVGDECFIPLPNWVTTVGNLNNDIYYTDQQKHRDQEYLSLGVDFVKIFPPMNIQTGQNRSAIDMYSDFMTAFRQEFYDMLSGQDGKGKNSLITTIEVGLGPAGEMRYPSYQLQNNLWQFPGIGAFQCYDKYMLQDLKQSAVNNGHADWGYAGPNDAGYYNSYPYQTGFFSENTNDNYASPYGKFFLQWYSSKLINHGDAILSSAKNIFGNFTNNIELAGKIAGIHWWYMTQNHAAELTAGYYNTLQYDGYNDIAKMFAKYDITFLFTCLEMLDSDQPSNCNCGPQELVQLTRQSAYRYNLRYGGENALPIYYNQNAYNQILKQSSRMNGKLLDSFTYLRLDQQMFNGNSYGMFTNFVQQMHNLN